MFFTAHSTLSIFNRCIFFTQFCFSPNKALMAALVPLRSYWQAAFFSVHELNTLSPHHRKSQGTYKLSDRFLRRPKNLLRSQPSSWFQSPRLQQATAVGSDGWLETTDTWRGVVFRSPYQLQMPANCTETRITKRSYSILNVQMECTFALLIMQFVNLNKPRKSHIGGQQRQYHCQRNHQVAAFNLV